jgi:hypothetical protein
LGVSTINATIFEEFIGTIETEIDSILIEEVSSKRKDGFKTMKKENPMNETLLMMDVFNQNNDAAN